MQLCHHPNITINSDLTLTCQDCKAKMSRVYWNWTITIGKRDGPKVEEPKPKVLIPAQPPNPNIVGLAPWNDPRLDSVPAADIMDEHEPEVQE